MSRARGLVLQNALARYLAAWWPLAESAGAGRPGTDVTNTPGIVWENKTPRRFDPYEWTLQAATHARNGQAAVTVYWPDKVGARRPELAIAMMPMPTLMRLLTEAGYTPEPGKSSNDQ